MEDLIYRVVVGVVGAIVFFALAVLCYWGWKRRQRLAKQRANRSLQRGIIQAANYLSASAVPDINSSQLVVYTSSRILPSQLEDEDGEISSTEQRAELLVRRPGYVDHHHTDQMDHRTKRVNQRVQQADHSTERTNCHAERKNYRTERKNRRAERMERRAERMGHSTERMSRRAERMGHNTEWMDRSTECMDNQFNPVPNNLFPPVPCYPPPPIPDVPTPLPPLPALPPPSVPNVPSSPVQRPVRMKRNTATRHSRSRRPQLTYYHSIRRKPATLPASLKFTNEKDLLGMPYQKTKYKRRYPRSSRSMDIRTCRKFDREVNGSCQAVNWEYDMSYKVTDGRSVMYAHERKKSGRITKTTCTGFKKRRSTRYRNRSPFPHLDPNPASSSNSSHTDAGCLDSAVAACAKVDDNHFYVSGAEVSQPSTPQPVHRSWDHRLHSSSNTQQQMLPLPAPPMEPPHVVASLLMNTPYNPRSTPRLQVDPPPDDSPTITINVQQTFGMFLRPPGEPMAGPDGGLGIRRRSPSQESSDGGSRSSSPKVESVTKFGSQKFENDYHL